MSGNSTNTTSSYTIIGSIDPTTCPELWGGLVFSLVALVLVIFHLLRSYTPLRLASALSLGAVFTLNTTNLLQLYLKTPLIIFVHALLFGIFSIIFAEILIGVLLSIGSTFRFPGPARTSFFWIVVTFGTTFFLTGTTLITILLFMRLSSTNYVTLVAFVLITGVLSEFSAALYTFKALVWKPNRPDLSQSEAFAVGVWYLILIVPVRIVYVCFYINTLVHFPSVAIFTQRHEAADLILRTLYCLAYGLPPSRRGIRYIRMKLSSRKTSNCCGVSDLDQMDSNKIDLEPGTLPSEDIENQI